MGCKVERRILVTHGTVKWGTGEYTPGRQEWETKPCGMPLFQLAELSTGICASCLKGWTHEHNHPTEAGLATIRAATKG